MAAYSIESPWALALDIVSLINVDEYIHVLQSPLLFLEYCGIPHGIDIQSLYLITSRK